MDFTQIRVPGAMILCITIAMIIAFGVPIALIIVWKKKTGANLLSALCGAGTFIVFAMILESILHNVVLAAIGNEAFTALPFYAVYGGLAAGVFEEIGRYIVMWLFMKRSLGKKEAIMFGIGHGGVSFHK